MNWRKRELRGQNIGQRTRDELEEERIKRTKHLTENKRTWDQTLTEQEYC
jgi:hypothetical protein